MNGNLWRGAWLVIARRGINPTAIHTKAAQSRLARFSGLCTNSTVVYHRAGEVGKPSFVRATDVRHKPLPVTRTVMMMVIVIEYVIIKMEN